jgi:hypothetical protein
MVLTQEHTQKASVEVEVIWETRTRLLEEGDEIFVLTMFPARHWEMKKMQIFGMLDAQVRYVMPIL